MQPILVTGGAGFIGAHTCKALAAHGLCPIVFDNLSRGHRELVQWGPFVQGDILQPADLDRAFKRYQPKSVIHFAALAYVGESVTQPLAYYQNNVSGLINVLDAMVRHGVDTIVFSSSCATYGIPYALPIAESARQQPISPYGQSKLMCEEILEHAAGPPLQIFGADYPTADGTCERDFIHVSNLASTSPRFVTSTMALKPCRLISGPAEPTPFSKSYQP
jgi:UDP-arabinose 4-epimerase